MHIAIDTTAELSALDKQILTVLAGDGEWPTAKVNGTPVETPAVKPAKKAPAPKPAPKPEPAEEPAPEPEAAAEPVVEETVEETVTEEETVEEAEAPTMADAVAAATKLVSGGNAGKVKEALASVDAKRVSEVAEDKIAAFLAALAA